ncbi:hypothetical protein vBRpoSV10_125 [Ruegeria phage vB_RpoS-V10]|nr:hypothetical protein vBRpoSV10_125 [Ruegeria phage vB_RpoS-V10]
MFSNMKSRATLWAAGLLLGLQTIIIGADTVMETWFFDELLGWLINAALVWIIAKQRAAYKAGAA